MNVELLQKVKAHILEEPARLRMSMWLSHGEPGKTVNAIEDWGEPGSITFPACGTVGCIAGWATALTEKLSGISSAVDVLQIDHTQANRLFFVTSWPPSFRDVYISGKTTVEERAKICADRIDHFIQTEGRE